MMNLGNAIRFCRTQRDDAGRAGRKGRSLSLVHLCWSRTSGIRLSASWKPSRPSLGCRPASCCSWPPTPPNSPRLIGNWRRNSLSPPCSLSGRSRVNRPCFKGRPITTLDALARALHFSPRQLRWAIERADTLYRPTKPIAKSDGSVRQTYDPAAPLKNIQRRINRNIFNRVMFPTYLQGGIRDRNNPRHCIANAKLHSGATIVINEDISSFFPQSPSNKCRTSGRISSTSRLKLRRR